MHSQSNRHRHPNPTAQPRWAEVWHLWNVVMPRRSITGRLVYGRVWRRRDGRRWIYKEFTEYSSEA